MSAMPVTLRDEVAAVTSIWDARCRACSCNVADVAVIARETALIRNCNANQGAMAMGMTLPSYASYVFVQKEGDSSELDATLPLWVFPKSLSKLAFPPGLDHPLPQTFQARACSAGLVRLGCHVQGRRQNSESPGRMLETLETVDRKIGSPRELEKPTYDFNIMFPGYDQQQHLEFELVPRLIGRGACNMAAIKKTGAGVCICGRGSGYLEKAAPNGKRRERDAPLHVAVSCSTRLGHVSEVCKSRLDPVWGRLDVRCTFSRKEFNAFTCFRLLPPSRRFRPHLHRGELGRFMEFAAPVAWVPLLPPSVLPPPPPPGFEVFLGGTWRGA